MALIDIKNAKAVKKEIRRLDDIDDPGPVVRTQLSLTQLKRSLTRWGSLLEKSSKPSLDTPMNGDMALPRGGSNGSGSHLPSPQRGQAEALVVLSSSQLQSAGI